MSNAKKECRGREATGTGHELRGKERVQRGKKNGAKSGTHEGEKIGSGGSIDLSTTGRIQ